MYPVENLTTSPTTWPPKRHWGDVLITAVMLVVAAGWGAILVCGAIVSAS